MVWDLQTSVLRNVSAIFPVGKWLCRNFKLSMLKSMPAPCLDFLIWICIEFLVFSLFPPPGEQITQGTHYLLQVINLSFF